MKKTLLNIGFLLASTTLVFGQWVQKSSFPDGARTAAVSFVIGNDAYVGSGQNSLGAPTRDFWKYNAISDTWLEIASLPAEAAAREGAIAFNINGKGYIGLGSSSGQSSATTFYKDFWEYNPVSDQWKAIAEFPGVARRDAIAFVIDGKAYVGAGRWFTSANSNQYPTDFYEYDPIDNEWESRKAVPEQGGANGVTFVVNKIGYFGTGRYYPGGTAIGDTDKDDLFAYSAIDNEWTKIKKASGNDALFRKEATAFVVEDKAFIGGGFDRRDFVMYDVGQQTFQDTSTFITSTEGKRSNMISFVIDGTAYAGLGSRGGVKQQDIWAIQLAEPSPAPILASGASTSRSLQLIWSSQTDLYTSFTLERSTDSVQFTPIATFENNTQFLDTHLAENTQYYYRIIGNKANNATEASNIVSASTRMHMPQSFAIIPDSDNPTPAKNTATKVYLHWINESAFASHVVIERYNESEGKFVAIAIVPAEDTPFTDTGLTAGISYQYRIKATSGVLSSLYSDTVSTNLRETVALSAPSELSIDYQDSIALTWKHGDPYTTHFLVERSKGEATDFQQVDSVSRSFPTDVFFSYDATIEEITQYHYRVIAATTYDSTLAAYSDTITITTSLYSPTALVVSQQDSSLSLSWQDQSEKETAYMIERSISQDSILSDDSSYTVIDSIGADMIMYNDTTALQDGYYHYRIKAISDTFVSSYLYGKVKVTVKKENEGNGGESGPITDLPQDIEETPITIYPNPSVHHVLIKASARMESIVLYNSRGVMLKKITDQALLSSSGTSLDVASLTSGMYIVQIQTSKGMAIQRIVKQ